MFPMSPFGMQFNPDLDSEEEQRPYGSMTVAEQTKTNIEYQRNNFYALRAQLKECVEGGRRHAATLEAYGPKSAEAMATSAKAAFDSVCRDCLLTPEGKTLDPELPVDKMNNRELRRLRANVILMVSNFMHYFESMMPENLAEWTYDMMYFNLQSIQTRFMDGCYQDLHAFLEPHGIRACTPAELQEDIQHCADLIKVMSPVSDGTTKEYMVAQIRKKFIDTILARMPFNNVRLIEAVKDEALH